MNTSVKKNNTLFLFVIIVTLWLVGGDLLAATTVDGVGSLVTTEVIESKINEVEASTEFDATVKSKLIETYRKTLSEIGKIRSQAAATKVFSDAMRSAPPSARKIRAALTAPLPTVSLKQLGLKESSPLALMEQTLVKEQADLSALEAKLADIEKQIDDQMNRPNEARKQLTLAKQAQEAISAQQKIPTSGDGIKELVEARKVLLQTRQRAISAEIKMLDQELLSQAVRVDLLQAQRDETVRGVSFAKAKVDILEKVVNKKRLDEAEQAQAQAAAAEREAVGKHELIINVVEDNAKLTTYLTTLAANLDNVADKEEKINQTAKQIEDDFRSAKQRLEIAGLSKALGRYLLDQRYLLPTIRSLNKELANREDLIAEAGLQQLKYLDERRRLRDTDLAVQTLVSEVSDVEKAAIIPELSSALKNRLELLDKVITTNGTYLRVLAEVDFAQRNLIRAVTEYDNFLAERLLWMPSVNMVDMPTLKTLPQEIGEIIKPQKWWEVLVTLGQQALARPVLIPSMFIFALLLGGERRMRNKIKEVSKNVGKLSADRFMFSVQALGLTILVALSWPLLFLAVGIELQVSAFSNEFTKAVGVSLLKVVPTFLFLRVFLIMCVYYGVARVHFGWSEDITKRIRREVYWLIFILFPSGFVALLSSEPILNSQGYSLSRLSFAIMMVSLTVFFTRLLHLKHGVLVKYFNRHPRSMLTRLRYIWYHLVNGLPVVLMVLSAVGYLYTAGVLTESLINTLWLILALVVVHELVVRWLLITRKRLALQAMRERIKTTKAKGSVSKESTSDFQKQAEANLQELDLAAIDSQTRKLLNTALLLTSVMGMWFIWSDVLPAFGILKDISLWQHIVIMDGEEKLVPITLANLALAIILITITSAAARNFPSVLEIALLQQLSLDSGSRYAIATLVRYTIVGLGIVLVFNALGGSWTQIQWLIAALGVGIGFGLQEIVANFISGVIILFERPIRVGDLVTVGDTTGEVTRIRIRATTIRNWDKQELVVPNKEFITGRLLNWSLSDKINRIVIPVGIAYGSDVTKALALLLEVAALHPRVLKEPVSKATFEEFGDNALILKLRCYLDALEYRLETFSELHESINQKFNEAGIVFAFPQRDIHIDSIKPIEVTLQQALKDY